MGHRAIQYALCACLTGILLPAAAGEEACVFLRTGGVYDEAVVQSNAVDWSATVDDERTVGLHTFSAHLSEAFARGLGGVAGFDDLPNGTVLASSNGAPPAALALGPDGALALPVAIATLLSNESVVAGTPDPGSYKAREPVSGLRMLSGASRLRFGFRTEDGVVEAGITVLSRRDVAARVTLTAQFSGGATASVTRTLSQGSTVDDTFFGFTAPEGLAITGLVFASPGFYTSLDDLAVVARGPFAPRVRRGGARPVAAGSVALEATVLNTGGGETEVTVFYGPGDGGEAAPGWPSSRAAPEPVASAPHECAILLSDLDPGGEYAYRFRAANSHTSTWTSAGLFRVPGPPTLSAARAEDVLPGAVALSASLASGGCANACACWGPYDGGASTAAWPHIGPGGAVTGAFSIAVEGLPPGDGFAARLFASNEAGAAWSEPVAFVAPAFPACLPGVVQRYAGAMLTSGRDEAGWVSSPLLASALDRSALRLLPDPSVQPPQDLEASHGIRSFDRTLTGGNPMHDAELYRLLYALSAEAGDPASGQAADEALRWFFTNCQSRATGLMPWGEHIGWDFRREWQSDQPAYPSDTGMHEFWGAWPLWDETWRLAPGAVTNFALGLWLHQVHDRSTGAFDRHARYESHRTASGYEFPRHGGFFIDTWSFAASRSEDAAFRSTMAGAIETVAGFFAAERSPEGAVPVQGLAPGDYQSSTTLELADALQSACRRLGDTLSPAVTGLVESIDFFFLSLPHDLASLASSGLVNEVAIPDRTVRSYYPLWPSPGGGPGEAFAALAALARYRSSGSPPYLRLAIASAERYAAASVPAGYRMPPQALAAPISLLRQIYGLTGDSRYLQRANGYARDALDLYMNASSPLPRLAPDLEHYETIGGGDDLMLELWRLARTAESDPALPLVTYRGEPISCTPSGAVVSALLVSAGSSPAHVRLACDSTDRGADPADWAGLGPPVAVTSAAPAAVTVSAGGLRGGTGYRFRVFASNGSGTASSGPGSFTTPAERAPFGLRAAPLSAQDVALAWEDAGAGECGYDVLVAPDPTGPWSLACSLMAGVTQRVVRALADDATHYFRVAARTESDVLCASQIASAHTFARGFAATGHYDPPSDANDAERSAAFAGASERAGESNVIGINTLRAFIGAGAGQGTSGVLDFESGFVGTDGWLVVSFGGGKSLVVRDSSDTLRDPVRQTSKGRIPVSGLARLDGSANPSWILEFGPVSSGAAGEQVTHAGVTVLGRDLDNPVSVHGLFTDGRWVRASAILRGSPDGEDDVFFGFAAPPGAGIALLRIVPALFTSLDDIGFVTSAGGHPDLDLDGLPDSWEIAHHGTIAAVSAGDDWDDDGATEEAELVAGTDPRSAADAFRIDSVRSVGPTLAEVSFAGDADHSYTIEQIRSLAVGDAADLSCALPGQTGLNVRTVRVDAAGPIILRVRIRQN